MRADARWYALNLASELDAPDEYWIDEERALLYVVDGPITRLGADVWVSVSRGLISGSNVNDVQVSDARLWYSRGTAVSFSNGSNVGISNCSVRAHLTRGVEMINVTRARLSGCEIAEIACGGALVSSGDALALVDGLANVSANNVHDYGRYKRTYQPGLEISGCVRCTVDGNWLHDAPHFGVHAGSRNVLTSFTRNRFERLLHETGDSGAFYARLSWSDRGNILKGNVFVDVHNTGPSLTLQMPNTHAIHLDDEMSGYSIIGNQIVRCQAGVRLGGGRDVLIHGNTFINTTVGIHFDNRGMTWASHDCSPSEPGAFLVSDLRAVLAFRPPLWATRFPELATTLGDHPCVPVHNQIENNTYCGAALFVDGGNGSALNASRVASEWLSSIANNMEDPTWCIRSETTTT